MNRSAFALVFALLAGRPALGQTIAPGWTDADGTEQVLIDSDAAICVDGHPLQIISFKRSPSGPGGSRRQALRGWTNPSCQWRIKSLPPGDYEAQVIGDRGVLAHAAFTVTAGEPSRVHMAASTVTVSGRITVNGAPVAGGSLLFTAGPMVPPVTTDRNGAFEVVLPTAGAYQVRVSGESIYLQFRSASFNAGRTQWDWTLPEGTLHVRLVGASPAQGRVMLRIADVKSGGFQTRALPLYDTDVVIEGVPFGVYQVAAERDDAVPTLVRSKTGGVVVAVNQTLPTQLVDVPVQGP